MLMTWLPLPSFKDSVTCLSDEHLGSLRYHVLEIMEYMHQPEDSQLPISYTGHEVYEDSPIIQMWKGYELQLIEYGLEACEVWAARHNDKNKMYEKLSLHLDWAATEDANMGKPNWFGEIEFHLSHQAELLRQDRMFYKEHFSWDGDRPLVWPVSDVA